MWISGYCRRTSSQFILIARWFPDTEPSPCPRRKAYEWVPDVSVDSLAEATQYGGYLLRTKIRAAIEFLDQLYQYGKAGKTSVNELGKETFDEDVPSLEDLQ